MRLLQAPTGSAGSVWDKGGTRGRSIQLLPAKSLVEKIGGWDNLLRTGNSRRRFSRSSSACSVAAMRQSPVEQVAEDAAQEGFGLATDNARILLRALATSLPSYSTGNRLRKSKACCGRVKLSNAINFASLARKTAQEKEQDEE